MSLVLSKFFICNHLTDFTAASSSAPASQTVGPSRTPSMVSTMASPPRKTVESRPLPPLSPPLNAESFGRPRLWSSTVDQPSSSQSSLPYCEPPASPPPQPRRIDTVEPVYVRSASTVPSPSRSEGAWECREGEDILMEDQIERCNSSSQDTDNMGQCDFRIFELRKDGYSLPTRRIAIRSCENGERCISFCEAP